MTEIRVKLQDLKKGIKLTTGGHHRIVLERACIHVADVGEEHFNTDSAVILPDQVPGLQASNAPVLRNRGLLALRSTYLHASQHPEQRILIAGHTDTAGSAAFNVQLSQLRADCVRCALLGEREGWVAIAQQRHRVLDYQLILRWVDELFGWNSDPGPLDDQLGTKTERAIRTFQNRYNIELSKSIAVDGRVGPQTWGAFFDMYAIELEALLKDDGLTIETARSAVAFVDDRRRSVGCGENHPIEGSSASQRSATNRRVEILFFDPNEKPALGCHPAPDACQPSACCIYTRGLYSFSPIPPATSIRASKVRLDPPSMVTHGNLMVRAERLDGKPFGPTMTLVLGDVIVRSPWLSPRGHLYFVPPPAQRGTSSDITVADGVFVHALENEAQYVSDPVEATRSLVRQVTIYQQAIEERIAHAKNEESELQARRRYECLQAKAGWRFEELMNAIQKEDIPPAEQRIIVAEVQAMIARKSNAVGSHLAANFPPQPVAVA